MERQLYPLGEHSFLKIRERGGVYVDKTMFIARLLEEWGFFFLSRPRRFGKSLFISTLEQFFLGNRHLFKGLFIDSYEKWDWEEYPIIRIDHTGGSFSIDFGLESGLNMIIDNHERNYGITAVGSTPGERLNSLIEELVKKFRKNVVILIDEYEKPLLDTIDKDYHERYKGELRDFYGVLKANVEKIRFLFITGVTRFGNLNIFSGLNNLQDISLRDEYSAICGITEDEILTNLRPGIEHFGLKNGLDFDNAFKELKLNYDGYHFSRELLDIYNPYSLLDCLNKSTLSSNWFESGSPSFLIELIKTKGYDLSEIDGIRVPESRLKTINAQLSDPVPLLYQSGYLTIKGYDREDEEYRLGYPNREVEKGMLEILIPLYLNKTTPDVSIPGGKLGRWLKEGNPSAVMEWLKGFFAGIPFDVHFRYENQFQTLILFIFNFIGLGRDIRVSVEEHTSRGSIDMAIETEENAYILEFKKDKTVQDALAQIEARRYYDKYRGSGKRVFCIGVRLDAPRHEIEGYEIVEKGVM